MEKYDWLQYRDFAQYLLNTIDKFEAPIEEETIFRNILSRAYYSAYHYTREYLECCGIEFSHGDSHIGVITSIKSIDNNHSLLGIKLERLKKKRVDADYKHNFPYSKRDIELSLRESINIINQIDQCKNEHH